MSIVCALADTTVRQSGRGTKTDRQTCSLCRVKVYTKNMARHMLTHKAGKGLAGGQMTVQSGFLNHATATEGPTTRAETAKRPAASDSGQTPRADIEEEKHICDIEAWIEQLDPDQREQIDDDGGADEEDPKTAAEDVRKFDNLALPTSARQSIGNCSRQLQDAGLVFVGTSGHSEKSAVVIQKLKVEGSRLEKFVAELDAHICGDGINLTSEEGGVHTRKTSSSREAKQVLLAVLKLKRDELVAACGDDEEAKAEVDVDVVLDNVAVAFSSGRMAKRFVEMLFRNQYMKNSVKNKLLGWKEVVKFLTGPKRFDERRFRRCNEAVIRFSHLTVKRHPSLITSKQTLDTMERTGQWLWSWQQEQLLQAFMPAYKELCRYCKTCFVDRKDDGAHLSLTSHAPLLKLLAGFLCLYLYRRVAPVRPQQYQALTVLHNEELLDDLKAHKSNPETRALPSVVLGDFKTRRVYGYATMVFDEADIDVLRLYMEGPRAATAKALAARGTRITMMEHDSVAHHGELSGASATKGGAGQRKAVFGEPLLLSTQGNGRLVSVQLTYFCLAMANRHVTATSLRSALETEQLQLRHYSRAQHEMVSRCQTHDSATVSTFYNVASAHADAKMVKQALADVVKQHHDDQAKLAGHSTVPTQSHDAPASGRLRGDETGGTSGLEGTAAPATSERGRRHAARERRRSRRGDVNAWVVPSSSSSSSSDGEGNTGSHHGRSAKQRRIDTEYSRYMSRETPRYSSYNSGEGYEHHNRLLQRRGSHHRDRRPKHRHHKRAGAAEKRRRGGRRRDDARNAKRSRRDHARYAGDSEADRQFGDRQEYGEYGARRRGRGGHRRRTRGDHSGTDEEGPTWHEAEDTGRDRDSCQSVASRSSSRHRDRAQTHRSVAAPRPANSNPKQIQWSDDARIAMCEFALQYVTDKGQLKVPWTVLAEEINHDDDARHAFPQLAAEPSIQRRAKLFGRTWTNMRASNNRSKVRQMPRYARLFDR